MPRTILLFVVLTALTTGALGGQTVAPYAARRAVVLAALHDDLLLVPSRESFKADDQPGFQQATDFQYLTGLDALVGAVLAIDGPSRTATLFIPQPNPAITRAMPGADGSTATALGLDRIVPMDSLRAWLVAGSPRWRRVLVSPTDLRGAVHTPVPMADGVTRWRAWLETLGMRGNVHAATEITRPLREIKDAGEIAILDRVGRLSGLAMLAGMRAVRPGTTQHAAEIAIVWACVRGGARGHSFWPWAMSGPRAVFTDLFNSFVDYEGHNRAMQAGELVRVDVGCQADHYQGDVGRTVPVSGRFSAGQREAWDLFIAGYRAGLVALRDGATAASVYAAAQGRIRELGPGMTTPMGRRAAALLLGPHAFDAWEIHGVGLDDAEGLPEVLKTGMTVAYELMFAVDGEGFYLEDMILITSDGYRMLTPGLPYSAREIEAAQRSRGR